MPIALEIGRNDEFAREKYSLDILSVIWLVSNILSIEHIMMNINNMVVRRLRVYGVARPTSPI